MKTFRAEVGRQLAEVMTRWQKLYRCAPTFIGKWTPPFYFLCSFMLIYVTGWLGLALTLSALAVYCTPLIFDEEISQHALQDKFKNWSYYLLMLNTVVQASLCLLASSFYGTRWMWISLAGAVCLLCFLYFLFMSYTRGVRNEPRFMVAATALMMMLSILIFSSEIMSILHWPDEEDREHTRVWYGCLPQGNRTFLFDKLSVPEGCYWGLNVRGSKGADDCGFHVLKYLGPYGYYSEDSIYYHCP